MAKQIISVRIKDWNFPLFDFEANAIIGTCWMGEDGKVYPHGSHYDKAFALVYNCMNHVSFQILENRARVVSWYGWDIRDECFCSIEDARQMYRFYLKKDYKPEEIVGE